MRYINVLKIYNQTINNKYIKTKKIVRGNYVKPDVVFA